MVIRARDWLAQRSVLYRFAFEASPIGNLFRAHVSYRVPTDQVTHVKIPGLNTGTMLAAPLRRSGLDLSDVRVQQGLRVSVAAFARMKVDADSAGADLLVAMIPSKVRVYAEYVESKPTLNHADIIDEIIGNERRIHAYMVAAFDSLGIDWVDTAPALAAAARTTVIYPPDSNGHPNAAGYEVIARTIADRLR